MEDGKERFAVLEHVEMEGFASVLTDEKYGPTVLILELGNLTTLSIERPRLENGSVMTAKIVDFHTEFE